MLAELATANKQVSDFLLDPAIYDTLEKIAQAHGLPVERAEEFLDITEAVMDRQLSLADVPAVIAEAFGVPEQQAQKIATEVIGYRVLPLANFLPGVEQVIKDWGGDLAQYPVVRVSKQKISASHFAEQVREHAQVTLPEGAAKRLGFLLWEMIRGRRTPEQFHEFLSRRSNAGGLGLATEMANKLFVQAMAEKDTVDLVDEDALAGHAIVPRRPVKNAGGNANNLTPLTPASANAQLTPLTPSEPSETEELAMAKKKAEKIVKKVSKDPREALSEAIQVAVAAAKPVLGEKSISEKLFSDVADKAIRGLRDIYQTRDVLEEGNKLSGTVLTGLLSAIKQGIDAYHKSQPAAATEDLDADDSASADPQADAVDLNSRHASLTRATSPRPAPAKAELTVGSVPLAQAEGQRKVVDVVSARRLMGPVEQLGSMSAADFRRLSTNPAEASQRLEDLIGSLAATSYEERVKGIEAWRRSPINQLYLTMAEEALAQGLSIPEISSRRRAAGQESLSPAEIKAITSLNARVRF